MNSLQPMSDRRFARIIRRMARSKYRKDEITHEDLKKLVRGSRDFEIVARWRAELSQPQYGAPWRGQEAVLTEINWASIWEWLKKNWPTVLRLLLSLLVLLGEQDEDSGTGQTH